MAPSGAVPSPPQEEMEKEHELFGPDDDDDQTNFYEIVNEDDEIMQNAQSLEDASHVHSTIALLDVLQTVGVCPTVAANFAASIARNKPRFHHLRDKLSRAQGFVYSVTGKKHTFLEVYGRGSILEAAHGCRRNLNLEGIDALDIRTCKHDGSPWDFTRAKDRDLAM